MLTGRKPIQGIWGLVEKMMEKYGSLNRKYDSQLRGIVDNSDKVDGHDAGTSAGNVLVLDTAGQVPLANIPLLPASQLGFSFAWELVGSISETGVSSIEFTGLAGDTDKLYLLVFAAHNPNTGATNGIFARFNADTTVTHYGYLGWVNEAGTVSSAYKGFPGTSGTAGAIIGGLPGGAVGLFWGIIHAEGISAGTNTYVFCIFNGFNTNSVRYDNDAGGWIKQAEVDTITLFTASGVTLNWTAYLFKPKW